MRNIFSILNTNLWNISKFFCVFLIYIKIYWFIKTDIKIITYLDQNYKIVTFINKSTIL